MEAYIMNNTIHKPTNKKDLNELIYINILRSINNPVNRTAQKPASTQSGGSIIKKPPKLSREEVKKRNLKKKWYDANKKKILAKQREYKRTHKEEIKIKEHEYYEKNKNGHV
jgi:hypothetical protein